MKEFFADLFRWAFGPFFASIPKETPIEPTQMDVDSIVFVDSDDEFESFADETRETCGPAIKLAELV
jgi:hypothetical protein